MFVLPFSMLMKKICTLFDKRAIKIKLSFGRNIFYWHENNRIYQLMSVVRNGEIVLSW